MPAIAEGALVCEGAEITGDVTIGEGTVVFPSCSIVSEEGAGSITVGPGCVVEECASIVNSGPESMTIGRGNLFEVGCSIRCKKIGEYNVFAPKCRVGADVIVEDGCSIGATVPVDLAMTVTTNSALFRAGDQPDEFKVNTPANGVSWNKCHVDSYRLALSNQGKKYYVGKYNKLLPPSPAPAPS